MLALTDHPARRWEPKRLRLRLFTVPATLARTSRRVLLPPGCQSPLGAARRTRNHKTPRHGRSRPNRAPRPHVGVANVTNRNVQLLQRTSRRDPSSCPLRFQRLGAGRAHGSSGAQVAPRPPHALRSFNALRRLRGTRLSPASSPGSLPALPCARWPCGCQPSAGRPCRCTRARHTARGPRGSGVPRQCPMNSGTVMSLRAVRVRGWALPEEERRPSWLRRRHH